MDNNGIPAKANDTTDLEALKAELEKYKKEAEVATKRHRDTQSAYTKERQAHLELQAKLKVLEEEMQTSSLNLADPQLEELKYSNPDAWYMEVQKRKAQTDQLRNQKISEAVAQQTNLYLSETRKNILEDFNLRHPDSMLTAEFLNEEIPPRIKKLQDAGDYEAYLQAAYEWGKKVVVGDSNTKVVTNTPTQPNLGNMGGVSSDIKTSPQKPKTIIY